MCASRSRSVLVRQVFYLFIDQTVYPRAVSPTRAPVKFPSGFLARKVKGTAPNPSRTRPHERLFRMRALAAYVYTVAEFQSAVEQGIYKKKGKRETERSRRGRRKGRVSLRVCLREGEYGGCDSDSGPIGCAHSSMRMEEYFATPH